MKRLSNKEIKEVNTALRSRYGENAIVVSEDGATDEEVLYIERKPMYFQALGTWVPTLQHLLSNNFLPCVAIDRGAVPFMIKGADVMRPGIVQTDEFSKDGIVAVVDATHRKPLCVGLALFSSSEILPMTSGKVIKNLHYVGDEVWKLV